MTRILPLFLITVLTGCYQDNREDLYPVVSCDTAGITYSGFIAPLLNQSCAISTCHDNETAAQNMVLDNYAGIQEIAVNGKLVGSLTHAAGFYPMPKSANKFDDCTLLKIKKWVNDGALEN
jgi:hypothetical protein